MSEKKWKAARAATRALLKDETKQLPPRTNRRPQTLRARHAQIAYLHTHAPAMRHVHFKRAVDRAVAALKQKAPTDGK